MKKKTYIYFWYFYKKILKVKDILLIYPKDLFNIIYKTNKYIKIEKRHFDIKLHVLSPCIYYKTIINHKIYFIILLSIKKIDIDNKFRYTIIIFCQKILKNILKKITKKIYC